MNFRTTPVADIKRDFTRGMTIVELVAKYRLNSQVIVSTLTKAVAYQGSGSHSKPLQ